MNLKTDTHLRQSFLKRFKGRINIINKHGKLTTINSSLKAFRVSPSVKQEALKRINSRNLYSMKVAMHKLTGNKIEQGAYKVYRQVEVKDFSKEIRSGGLDEGESSIFRNNEDITLPYINSKLKRTWKTGYKSAQRLRLIPEHELYRQNIKLQFPYK